MKKHISLLLCFSLVLTLFSCSDWLDVKPTTQKDRDELLSNERGYGEAMKGIYTQLCDQALYGRHLTWGALDGFAGVYQASYSGIFNDIRQYNYVEVYGYKSPALVSLVGEFWNKIYNAIAGLNSVLDQIDGSKDIFSGDNYAVIKGEAIGLRAFLHLEILRLYGDIYEKCKDQNVMPYVTELKPLVTAELTGEQAIGKIIEQLEAAITLLEKDPMYLDTAPPSVLASSVSANTGNNIRVWHNRRFHFNYYAAKATLARAYLWKGDKTNALSTALEVIAAQETHFPWVLAGNLSNIGSPSSAAQDRTFTTEHIFALNIVNLEDLTVGYHDMTTTSNNLFLNVDMFPGNEEGTDPRRLRLITSPSPGNYMLGKFYQQANVTDYFRSRLPLIRISEMHYIAAECSTSWSDGAKYIQTVREHRNVGNIALTVDSDAALQTAIQSEYRKEFMGEGQLWHYYKRHQYASIPNMWGFPGTYAYPFPRPENEDLYGERN